MLYNKLYIIYYADLKTSKMSWTAKLLTTLQQYVLYVYECIKNTTYLYFKPKQLGAVLSDNIHSKKIHIYRNNFMNILSLPNFGE